MPDAVVIGAGPNGLVAANMLADRGWSVTVLEAAPEPGGAVRSAELIEPGFVNDMFSAFYPFAFASPAITSLKLEEYGLRWRRAPLVLAHPATDGTCPVLSTDLDETAASLDDVPSAATATRGAGSTTAGAGCAIRCSRRCSRRRRRSRRAAQLATRAWSDGWTRIARFALLSVRRMGEEEFGSDARPPPARRLARCTPISRPRRCSAASSRGCSAGSAKTSAGRFPKAVRVSSPPRSWQRLRARGGDVVCDSPVDRIVIRDRRAVAVRDARRRGAGRRERCSPTSVRRRSTSISSAPSTCRRSVVDDVRRFEWDNATVKVDWNLDRPIPWAAEPARRAGHAAPRRECRRADRVELRARARARAGHAVPRHGPAVDDRSDPHARGRGDGVGVLARAARDPRRRGRARLERSARPLRARTLRRPHAARGRDARARLRRRACAAGT